MVFRNNIIYFVVFIIGALLVTDIILTNYNNTIIKQNKELQAATGTIKTYYDQIGKAVIHSLDIGLRGYAIIREEKFSAPMDNALIWKDSILDHVERPLRKLNYNMSEFLVFKDSLNAYSRYCFNLKQLLDAGKDEEFSSIFRSDKGAHLYWQYLQCEDSIVEFLNRIDAEAQSKYEAALSRNHILQIILFAICFPTLLYTAFYAKKTFRLSELLRIAEADKNKILTEQNTLLEHLVTQRTQELATQNEEVISQSEELSAHRDALAMQNRKLHEAQEIIGRQNREIQSKNERLEVEVQNRTMALQHANEELIQQNNQLEQFAFIAAHNLRAPLARILGLVNVMHISPTQEDKDIAIQKLVQSTVDLDSVIRDLNTILDIKKHTGNLVKVDLRSTLSRVLKILEKECEETGTQVLSNFDEADTVYAVSPYVESILYNLISNAIKYRHPNREPVITIRTTLEPEYTGLIVSDNGLGIDLLKHKGNMFNLYKRFHLHMEGRGLGLYLVKTQIEALGGKVEVESELEKGTRFAVYFRR